MKKSAQTVIRPDAYYTIAAANGRVLEVADFNTENGASVRLWSYEGQPWQQWQFVEAGEGRVPHQEPLYRQGHGPGHVRRVQRHLGPPVEPDPPGAGQRWQLVDAGGGKVKLRNVLADKVIDLVGHARGQRHPGPDLQDVFGENQLWKLDPVPARLLDKEPPAPKPGTRKAAPKTTRTQTEKKTSGKAAPADK